MKDLTYKKDIGKRLKNYRLEREWSLAKLSQVTRISVSALWYIEQGENTPSDLTMFKLDKALPGLIDHAA